MKKGLTGRFSELFQASICSQTAGQRKRFSREAEDIITTAQWRVNYIDIANLVIN